MVDPVGPREGLVITGFFRTGSTFVFSALRADDRFRCFYEPYHPLLPDYLADSDDPAHRADAGFLGHTIEDDYFREYRDIPRDEFAAHFPLKGRLSDHPVLAGGQAGGEMRGYIDFLVDAARARGRRPVLQCNRWNLILPWLKARYPEHLVVLITRSPVAVAMSLQGLAAKQGRSLDILSPRADFWGVGETVRNICLYYDVDARVVSEFSYFQKIHFAIRFAERVLGGHADVVIDYDRLGTDWPATLDIIGRRLGMTLEASAAFFRAHWRPDRDRSAVEQLLRGQAEMPEALLAELVSAAVGSAGAAVAASTRDAAGTF